jgi:hypothetical protein
MSLWRPTRTNHNRRRSPRSAAGQMACSWR